MSFSESGVRLHTKRGKSVFFSFFTATAEAILSVVFVITLAAPIVFPNQANAALGVPQKLSYQGRLTDTNGNPLTGTYCVRFSVYDAVSAGNKLWPSGTPTSNSVSVSNGVFNVAVGVTDTLDFDFSSNDTTYLNVEVNATVTTCGGTWEELSPRQRLDAVAYARVAAGVYGPALAATSTIVRVGAGSGAGTPVWLNLDNKNTASALGDTCPSGSVNGSLWYNSSGTRALVCLNNVIKAIDNTADFAGIKESATGSTVNAGTIVLSNAGGISISQSTATLATNQTNQTIGTFGFSNLNAGGVSTMGNTLGDTGVGTGTIFFAGGNNITLSQATAAGARTITISAGAGGGGLAGIGASNTTYTSGTVIFSGLANITINSSVNGASQYVQISAPNPGGGGGVTYSGYAPDIFGKEQVAGQQGQGTFFVQPMWNTPAFQFDRFVMPINFSNTSNLSGSATVSFWVGIYTSNASTLSLLHSTSHTTNVTMSGTVGSYSLYGGPRNYIIPWTSTIAPSDYWIGIGSRTTSGGANMSISQFLASQPNSVLSGNFGVASNATKGLILGNGFYSATTSAVPASIAFTQINASGSLNRRPPTYFFVSNTL